jgi:hypothetical protein
VGRDVASDRADRPGGGSARRLAGAVDFGIMGLCGIPPPAIALTSGFLAGPSGADPSMTLSGVMTRRPSAWAERSSARTSAPHDSQGACHPLVRAPQLQQCPGGPSSRRASAAGPRIAPKMAHVRGRRWRVIATLAAAAANPMSQAATKKAMTGLISTPQQASVNVAARCPVAAPRHTLRHCPGASGHRPSVRPVHRPRFGAAWHRETGDQRPADIASAGTHISTGAA